MNSSGTRVGYHGGRDRRVPGYLCEPRNGRDQKAPISLPMTAKIAPRTTTILQVVSQNAGPSGRDIAPQG